jgi:hypothetical protein
MKVSFWKPPWYPAEPSHELRSIPAIIKGSWQCAVVEFVAAHRAKRALGKVGPKGIQRFLNRELNQRFTDAGWTVNDGRYVCESTLVRVTFRHQMSIGSDIVDAIRAVGREKITQVAILAASRSFLRDISPNDAAALASFEKIRTEVQSLNNCVTLPLLLGVLEPGAELPSELGRVVKERRPRDTYMPQS